MVVPNYVVFSNKIDTKIVKKLFNKAVSLHLHFIFQLPGIHLASFFPEAVVFIYSGVLFSMKRFFSLLKSAVTVSSKRA